MDTRILTKIARNEYSVEKLIDREMELIRQIKQTGPNSRHKRYKMDRRLRAAAQEREICSIKLTENIKASQKPKQIDCYVNQREINDFQSTMDDFDGLQL